MKINNSFGYYDLQYVVHHVTRIHAHTTVLLISNVRIVNNYYKLYIFLCCCDRNFYLVVIFTITVITLLRCKYTETSQIANSNGNLLFCLNFKKCVYYYYFIKKLLYVK